MEIPTEPLDRALQTTLSRYPASALPVSGVVALMRAQGASQPLPPRTLLTIVDRNPERYRMIPLPGPLGPWLSYLDSGSRRMFGEPWVVSLVPGCGHADPVLGSVRRTMSILGRELDIRSPRAVIRWMEMVQEERALTGVTWNSPDHHRSSRSPLIGSNP